MNNDQIIMLIIYIVFGAGAVLFAVMLLKLLLGWIFRINERVKLSQENNKLLRELNEKLSNGRM